VYNLKKADFWYDDIQFLTRNVGPDRLSKHSRDLRYDIFKTGEAYSYSQSEMQELDKIIDAHVGMQGKSVNHRGLVEVI